MRATKQKRNGQRASGASIKIDKGKPLPPANYPFARMDIGDSFFVQGGTTAKLSNCSGSFARRHGKRFTTRAEAGGARVWRVE